MAIEQQLSQKTTGGASFGQSASDKVSLYGATPVVQAAHIATPTDLATSITAITAILVALENLGVTATS